MTESRLQATVSEQQSAKTGTGQRRNSKRHAKEEAAGSSREEDEGGPIDRSRPSAGLGIKLAAREQAGRLEERLSLRQQARRLEVARTSRAEK